MDMTYVFAILGLALVLYLMGSLRVLRQYERGVVFLLGKFEGVRGPGLTLIFVPIQQMVPRIFANRYDANPLTKNHYEG